MSNENPHAFQKAMTFVQKEMAKITDEDIDAAFGTGMNWTYNSILGFLDATVPNKAYLSIKDVCGLLQLSRSTVLRMLKSGVLRSIKVSGSIRISTYDLAALLYGLYIRPADGEPVEAQN